MSHKPSYKGWLQTLLCVWCIVVLLSNDAAALLRHDGTGEGPGRSHGGCQHATDGNQCWVEAPDSNSYFDPKVKVVYETSFFGTAKKKRNATLSHGECKWIYWYYPFPIRVCARFAGPGKYGNNSPDQELRLCAYEDPCDGMDCVGSGAPDSSVSPFHHNTPADDAKTAAEGAEEGAIIGAFVGAGTLLFFGPAGLALATLSVGLGASIGALTAVIQSHYNHVVYRNIGCVEIPLAEGPPSFAHGAFFGPEPHPTIEVNPSASFEVPTVDLRLCEDSDGRQIVCKPGESTVAGYPVQLTPRETSVYTDCVSQAHTTYGSGPDLVEAIKACNYEDCTSINSRQYCALISTNKPDYVCVYHRETHDYLVGCVKRPGYLPLPAVTMQLGPKLDVALGGKSVTLIEDPGLYDQNIQVDDDWIADCGILHQKEFCAYRRCLARDTDPTTAPDYDSANPSASKLPTPCISWESEICVSGYDRAPIVAIDTASGATLATKSSPPAPNQYNTRYVAGSVVPNAPYPSFSLAQDILIYENDVDENSPYKDFDNIDTTTQSIRQVTPDELGLCLPTPPITTTVEYAASNSTYDYTVPTNCTQLDVRLIGGGGGGRAQQGHDGSCRRHFAGGAGANGHWRIDVTPGEVLTVRVGEGSETTGTSEPPNPVVWVQNDGKSSYIKRNGTILVQAGRGFGYNKTTSCSNGGDAENGGTYSPTTSGNGIVVRSDSKHGESGRNSWEPGASGPGGGTNVYSCIYNNRTSVYGAGGCARDSGGPDKPRNSELGGHGRAYLRCVWPYESP